MGTALPFSGFGCSSFRYSHYLSPMKILLLLWWFASARISIPAASKFRTKKRRILSCPVVIVKPKNLISTLQVIFGLKKQENVLIRVLICGPRTFFWVAGTVPALAIIKHLIMQIDYTVVVCQDIIQGGLDPEPGLVDKNFSHICFPFGEQAVTT